MMKDWKKYLLGYCLIAVLVLPVQAQILQISSETMQHRNCRDTIISYPVNF